MGIEIVRKNSSTYLVINDGDNVIFRLHKHKGEKSCFGCDDIDFAIVDAETNEVITKRRSISECKEFLKRHITGN